MCKDGGLAMNDLIVAAAANSVLRLVGRFICVISALVGVIAILALTGCSSKPVIQTQVIEKPVAVHCEVETPPECKDSYAVDRVSPKDDAVTINRAFRQELEERWACEIKLRAAVKGCNQPLGAKQ